MTNGSPHHYALGFGHTGRYGGGERQQYYDNLAGQLYMPQQPYPQPWEQLPWHTATQPAVTSSVPGGDPRGNHGCPPAHREFVPTPYCEQRRWNYNNQRQRDRPTVDPSRPEYTDLAGSSQYAPPGTTTAAPIAPSLPYQRDNDGSISGTGTGSLSIASLLMEISPSVLQEVRADLQRKREEEAMRQAVVTARQIREAEERRLAEQRGRELQDLLQKMTGGVGLPVAPTLSSATPLAATPASVRTPTPVSTLAPVPTRDPRTRAIDLTVTAPVEPPENAQHSAVERAAEFARKVDDSGLSRVVLEALSVSLENGRVYELVARLKSEQAAREKELFERRKLLRHQHDKRKRLAQVLTGSENPVQEEQEEMEKEMRELDSNVISELETLLQEQQRALQSLEVPGFFPTQDPTQLETQAKVMSVIVKNMPQVS